MIYLIWLQFTIYIFTVFGTVKNQTVNVFKTNFLWKKFHSNIFKKNLFLYMAFDCVLKLFECIYHEKDRRFGSDPKWIWTIYLFWKRCTSNNLRPNIPSITRVNDFSHADFKKPFQIPVGTVCTFLSLFQKKCVVFIKKNIWNKAYYSYM